MGFASAGSGCSCSARTAALTTVCVLSFILVALPQHAAPWVLWASRGVVSFPLGASLLCPFFVDAHAPVDAVYPWALLQFDNRAPPQLDGLVRNVAYAARHGYAHLFLNDSAELERMPAYWVKVELVRRLLDAPDPANAARRLYGGVMWLDMDAVVRDTSVSMEDLWTRAHVPSRATFVGAADHPTPDGKPGAPFCAGVWAVRNTPTGRDLIAAWLGLFHPEEWTHVEKTVWRTDGEWAGPVYEQGAFSWGLLTQRGCDVAMLPWRTFASQETDDDQAFTLHYAGKHTELPGAVAALEAQDAERAAAAADAARGSRGRQ